ncbi:similar to Saccharomyces cerevisiae YCR016W Putative protein of unknown function [Maudiozyma saulgeensis]|uniref:WKF domain-containing protein n=1 Tax=Maudiozyma saulgeensis TaxID=1789683 RepID=A0A1X7R9P1_9SACH|nr:similar to Saccharomyces cerevisiae YCR016W Putative protein of unknown function [Kazachstania saulgeensis]
MENTHVPAWKRIAIKKQNNDATDDFSTEDPLNVTTHLSTGSLSRKEKKRIINKDPDLGKSKNKVTKTKKDKKKLKLSREERLQKKNVVLKDQLRYLLDFYKTKVSEDIPKSVLNLENVKMNYSHNVEDTDKEPQSLVVDVWKFAKSKQNWLIKHFFNIEEIPIEYDDILIEYFKDLKGKMKDDLIQKCLAQIKDWNVYTVAEEQKIKDMVEGNDNKKESKDEDKKGEDGDKLNDDPDKDGEDKDENKKEEQPEIVPPSKFVVSRSHKLLTRWAQFEDESIDKSSMELLNFSL